MRTTLTIEPDVAAELERRRRERHSSLKAEVNHLLRVGLEHERESAGTLAPEPFRVEPLSVGELLIDVDDVTAALDLIEPPRCDPARRQPARPRALPRVSDAHLAALAIEHGLTVCSTDRDFSRFPGVRWENPLSRG